jgi:hypothetical protein
MSSIKFKNPLYTPPEKPETLMKEIPDFTPVSSAPKKPVSLNFTKKVVPKGGKTRKRRSKKKKTHRRRR